MIYNTIIIRFGELTTKGKNRKDFINKLIVDISNQKVVIQNISKVLELKRKEVNEILKEKKVLEKLKENQKKKYYQSYEQYQTRELDDIASSRYARV